MSTKSRDSGIEFVARSLSMHFAVLKRFSAYPLHTAWESRYTWDRSKASANDFGRRQDGSAPFNIRYTFSCGRYSRYSIICTVSFRNLCFFRVNSLCRRNLYLESVVVITTYGPGALGCTRERGLLCRLNLKFSNASNVRSNPYTQAGRHHA